MNKAKRLLSVILTALIIMQAGALIAFGDSEESDKQVITISNIDTSQLTGESGFWTGFCPSLKSKTNACKCKTIGIKWPRQGGNCHGKNG